ncbi:MAG: DUF3107 domain-containing protein [Nocardioides sp.]|uniref:DUF3107 domain-containing protein n=1 Tax=Nocardioides sp. TaxID=35761 RepID=UPI00262CF40B|nr:DUF3107 domain-containing protein [Nocardioides sp.]
MDVKIGIQMAAREITLETDETAESIAAKVAEAVTSDGLLTLGDTKGRTVVVPGSKIAYVECGSTQVGTVGFRS